MVIICTLILIGVFSNALVDEEMVGTLVWSGIIFSILVLVPILLMITKPGSKYRANIQASGRSLLSVIFATSLFIPAMCIGAFYKGAPVVLNYIVGTKGSVEVTVATKPAGYHHTYCNGRLNIKEYSSFTNNYICGLNEEDWKVIKKGSKILLSGKKSMFGINYSNYKF